MGAVGVDRVQRLAPGSKIVVLSLLGDKLAIRYVGTTVFNNRQHDADVSDWRIDQYAQSEANEIINISGKFIAIDANTEQARQAAGSLVSNSFTGSVKVEGGTASIVQLAQATGAQYVLMLGPSFMGDPYFGTNQFFSGYGIYERVLMSSKNAINFLTLRVALFDGRSGAEIARTESFLGSSRTGPDWMESFDLELTDENSRNTKDSVVAMIVKLLHKELLELKLAL